MATMRLDAIDVAALHRAAAANDIPYPDVALIALNALGVTGDLGLPRVRMQLRLPRHADTWQIILPLGERGSPFSMDNEGVHLKGSLIASVCGWENDDVVLTYFRKNRRAITLNSYSRSTCTGCVFCPNVIEDAADRVVSYKDEFEALLSWICADNGWDDLRAADVVSVCSGCFKTPEAATAHLSALRRATEAFGFGGRMHLLSSVVRSRDDLKRLNDEAGPFHLTLTLECFERRDLLLKRSKASLTLEEACRILDDCARIGMDGDFTYVVGLDRLETAVEGLSRLADHVTTFPRIQILQAHNDYMRRYRGPGAESLQYFLDVRHRTESAFAARGLAPQSWENYRPLWYTRFAGEAVAGPRI